MITTIQHVPATRTFFDNELKAIMQVHGLQVDEVSLDNFKRVIHLYSGRTVEQWVNIYNLSKGEF